MLTDQEYVLLERKILRELDDESKEYQNAIQQMIEYNKHLVGEYPFLIPRNRFTDKVDEGYDYSYTELDAMLPGWRIAFGMDMLKEIKEELVKFNLLEEFRIMQIKEKYGALRFYMGEIPRDSKFFDIISKYEGLSCEICQRCGKPAKYESTGWIGFFCEDCAKKVGLDNFIKLKD